MCPLDMHAPPYDPDTGMPPTYDPDTGMSVEQI